MTEEQAWAIGRGAARDAARKVGMSQPMVLAELNRCCRSDRALLEALTLLGLAVIQQKAATVTQSDGGIA